MTPLDKVVHYNYVISMATYCAKVHADVRTRNITKLVMLLSILLAYKTVVIIRFQWYICRGGGGGGSTDSNTVSSRVQEKKIIRGVVFVLLHQACHPHIADKVSKSNIFKKRVCLKKTKVVLV